MHAIIYKALFAFWLHKYIPISLPFLEHYSIFQMSFSKILLLFHSEYLQVTQNEIISWRFSLLGTWNQTGSNHVTCGHYVNNQQISFQHFTMHSFIIKCMCTSALNEPSSVHGLSALKTAVNVPAWVSKTAVWIVLCHDSQSTDLATDLIFFY